MRRLGLRSWRPSLPLAFGGGSCLCRLRFRELIQCSPGIPPFSPESLSSRRSRLSFQGPPLKRSPSRLFPPISLCFCTPLWNSTQSSQLPSDSSYHSPEYRSCLRFSPDWLSKDRKLYQIPWRSIRDEVLYPTADWLIPARPQQE